ncbi:MAG: 2-oxoglutarate and iron-dependent oxygenase domain-containing protein [Rhodospirillales bacterium]
MDEIPVIDVSGFEAGARDAVAALDLACREVGFFCVTGHGVAPGLIAALRRATIEVFAQPAAVKARLRVTPENYRGYIPFGFFTPNAAPGAPDRYEGYKLHLEVDPDDPICKACSLYGPNLWPESLPGLKPVVLAYWRALDGLTDRLLRGFALALRLQPGVFRPAFEAPLTGMTLLHYPTATGAGFGIHPHKDSSALTILYPDALGGLLTRSRRGQWIEVSAPEGAFVVNIGDVMEHWSGGHYLSTPHKVVTLSERFSFPYFATPRYDRLVEPLVPPVAGYTRPPRLMETWQREIFRSNWPGTASLSGAFAPGVDDPARPSAFKTREKDPS